MLHAILCHAMYLYIDWNWNPWFLWSGVSTRPMWWERSTCWDWQREWVHVFCWPVPVRFTVIHFNTLRLRPTGATLIPLVIFLINYAYFPIAPIWMRVNFILYTEINIFPSSCGVCRCKKLLWWGEAHCGDLGHGLPQRRWHWGWFILIITLFNVYMHATYQYHLN